MLHASCKICRQGKTPIFHGLEVFVHGLHLCTMKVPADLDFTNSYARLPAAFYSRVRPAPLANTRLLSFNTAAAGLLDLSPDVATQDDFLRCLSGEDSLPGSDPLAMLYAGHQFGHFVPQLGDGRAILLGEIRNRRNELWEIQLKGSGLTAYSRRGDGRAVLRSSIREYLCSEAMHGLGIPSSRALCLFGSDEEVWREQPETGALLVRLAPSHVRFGSFEVFYHRHQYDHLQQLADHIIDLHYPALREEENPGLALFAEVVARTARLIAHWQAVGFAHGVMNTDNMSILGLTIDYGPFAFLDDFDPGLVCNHSDHQGRYAFDRQASIAHWNLSCLGQAMLPLFGEPLERGAEQANAILETYPALFHAHYRKLMQDKLGLREAMTAGEPLLADLLGLLAGQKIDYTCFFRALGNFSSCNPDDNAVLEEIFADKAAWQSWATDYRQLLQAEQSDDAARGRRMAGCNPKFILRNYLAQQAIDKALQGDNSEIDTLLMLLQSPCEEHEGYSSYAAPPPEWGRRMRISCSS